ncbi:MAG TPA: hypothetical protein V6C97_06430 [Oculatellaceae cyanobacterium]
MSFDSFNFKADDSIKISREGAQALTKLAADGVLGAYACRQNIGDFGNVPGFKTPGLDDPGFGGQHPNSDNSGTIPGFGDGKRVTDPGMTPQHLELPPLPGFGTKPAQPSTGCGREF